MPAKEVVIENGFVVSAVPQGPGIPNSATFQFVKIPSPRMKCDNQAVLVQMLTVIGASCSSPAGLCMGTGVVNATAAKTKSNNMAVLRCGDSGTCNGTALVPSGPSTTTTATTCRLEIAFAGQVRVKGE